MMVGPAMNTNTARIRASTILMLDSHWMPFSTPEIAEATKATVSTAMIRTSSPVPVFSFQFSSWNPLLICSAPRPSEAAEPKSVAKMARMSISLPTPPWACRAPMSGSKTALMVCCLRRRKVL